VNRSLVLRRLFLEGPLNRVVLAQLTGLSGGSVTNVAAALLEEGVICEVGLEESDGGRPRVQLEVNPDFATVVGVEVGETRIRVEAFDMKMRVVRAADVAMHPQHHDPDLVVEEINGAVEALRADLASTGDHGPLLGVGVAVPGMVGRHEGQLRVHAPNIGWRDVPLEPMAARLGVPVFADNGAKAFGQAEMWLGAGRGVNHAVVTLWGTGVGAAIFTDGTIYRGATSSAGEWGHTCVVVGGRRCRCGGAGCIEAYIGSQALLEEWYRCDPDASRLSDPDSEEWADRFSEASRSNPAAAAALKNTATYFGTGVANLVNLFNPQKVVIGGWIGLKLGPPLLGEIKRVVSQQALAYAAGGVRIEVGQLGVEAVALGASMLVVDALLANGGVPPVPLTAKRRLPALS